MTVGKADAQLDFIDWRRAEAEFKPLDQVVGKPEEGPISISVY